MRFICCTNGLTNHGFVMKLIVAATCLLLICVSRSASAQMQDFSCSDTELQNFSVGEGFDEIDKGQAAFDSRTRYCFAEALIRTIDNAYLKRVPRVKPEKVSWLEGEYFSGDVNRVVGAYSDKDFQRWRYYVFFDTLKGHLETVQNTQRLSLPAWEVSNWLWVLHSLNDTHFPQAERAMSASGYLPNPTGGGQSNHSRFVLA